MGEAVKCAKCNTEGEARPIRLCESCTARILPKEVYDILKRLGRILSDAEWNTLNEWFKDDQN